MTCATKVVERDLSLRLPGGGLIQVQYPGSDFPNGLQLAMQLMAQSSAATAPLAPIFDIIGAVMAIKDFAEAVPNLITDPPAVAEAIVKVVETTAALAQVVPPVSVPALILDAVDLMISTVDGMIEEVRSLADLQSRTASAQSLMESTGNVTLQEAIDCAEEILGARQENLDQMIASTGGFVALANAMGELVGLPALPALDALPSDLGEAEEALSDVQTVLGAIRVLIPS
jgi:hypothetical protein